MKWNDIRASEKRTIAEPRKKRYWRALKAGQDVDYIPGFDDGEQPQERR